MRCLIVLVALATTGCGDDGAEPNDAGTDAGRPSRVQVGPPERPAPLVLPFEADRPMPLVVLLHGYSVSAAVQDAYFRTTPRARARGFALLLPDGTVDESGNRFWNALPGFMGLEDTVDDVAYLLGLVDEAIARFGVDPERVYLLGHSNGGFMAYRLACEAADRIAALASLAGSSASDPTGCRPSQPVSVLQIHGDGDDTILYEGEPGYAGAVEVSERWAAIDGCATTGEAGVPVDFDTELSGAETEVLRYPGCTGAAVELWTIRGGGHLPAVSDDGIDATLSWLLAR